MKKRILVLLSAVALMVVRLATSVAPAFAKKQWNCVDPTRQNEPVLVDKKAEVEEQEAQGFVCTEVPKKPTPV